MYFLSVCSPDCHFKICDTVSAYSQRLNDYFETLREAYFACSYGPGKFFFFFFFKVRKSRDTVLLSVWHFFHQKDGCILLVEFEKVNLTVSLHTVRENINFLSYPVHVVVSHKRFQN